MVIQTALSGKIISLLLLFQLLIAYIGQKIEFNEPADAPELPLKTNAS
jgi:putative effector of murein hydrolase LrgA (UPF0299 family)